MLLHVYHIQGMLSMYHRVLAYLVIVLEAYKSFEKERVHGIWSGRAIILYPSNQWLQFYNSTILQFYTTPIVYIVLRLINFFILNLMHTTACNDVDFNSTRRFQFYT